jgi:hypothetical protein
MRRLSLPPLAGWNLHRLVWPSHHENVNFYGTHSVDVDGELAKLDADGYRPLRPTAIPPTVT